MTLIIAILIAAGAIFAGASSLVLLYLHDWLGGAVTGLLAVILFLLFRWIWTATARLI
jgi:hypothetical protein